MGPNMDRTKWDIANYILYKQKMYKELYGLALIVTVRNCTHTSEVDGKQVNVPEVELLTYEEN